LEVQFCNFSIGDIIASEWDFENDGIVDSHEKNPDFTYSDTGWHSVNLTVYDGIDTNSFTKENYIYVYQITDIEEILDEELSIQCYPNPFSNQINFKLPQTGKNASKELTIYNIEGELVKRIYSNKGNVSWNGANDSGNKCPPGIYFVRFDNTSFSKKILLTN
ncbi:MAG: T9SS type A sorting domain-containing protein, partial [Bacteroidales bacterium]|nr:T9SS type A sorting domain-containing protein [Bacteroidales bacterium]